MYVYFVQSEKGGPVKIGTALRPDRRVAALQPASPYPLVILGVAAGGRIAETTLHRKFASSRIGTSEWFKPSSELLDLISVLPSWEDVYAGADCPEIELLDNYRQTLVDLWIMGYSFDDIGGLLGVTRQRAHQIIRPLVAETVDRPKRPSEPIESTFARLSGE